MGFAEAAIVRTTSQIHLQNEFECDGEKEREGAQGTSKTRAGRLKWKTKGSESNAGR